MKLLDSSSVAVYMSSKFFVVEIADLSIRQRIFFSEPPKEQNLKEYGDIYYIQNYVKNESGVVKNTMVLGYQGVVAQILEYNYKTNLYEKVNEVYKPWGDYYLTGSDGGISFWNYNKVPSTFKEGFKFFDKETPLNPGYNYFQVSNSE